MADGQATVAKSFSMGCEVIKIDERLGVIFGFAIVCTVNGEKYYDTQGDHIAEDVMLQAVLSYMQGKRPIKIQHEGESRGQMVFGFPLTADIAAALGLKTNRTGFIVGVKPDSKEIITAYEQGKLRGFSIGGVGERREVSA